MVGYVIGSAKKRYLVSADVRLTIADLICDRYLYVPFSIYVKKMELHLQRKR